MSDSDEDPFAGYVAAWRERLARQEREKKERVRHLRQVAQECARLLIADFGARRVYLFGSLLDEDLAHDRSDIDLAVEGMDGSLYWRALSALWALLPPGVELDLVPLEQAWPGLAERVKVEGALLAVAAKSRPPCGACR